MISNNKPSNRLFIGSLPYRFTEGELLSLFIKFGRVTAVRIVKNRWGKSRGLGYVEFENIEEAKTAKAKMDGYYVEERTIIVDFAQPDPFSTPEGRQRHFEAQEKKPLEKRKYLDDFGNRKFAVPRPKSDNAPRRPFSSSNDRFEPKSFGNRDRRYNDDRPSSFSKFGDRPSRPQNSSSSFNRRPSRPQNNDAGSGFGYFQENNANNTKRRFDKGGKPKFNSLGRSLNKDRSEEYFPKFMADAPARPNKKFRPKFGQKPEYKASDPYHVRGSVFKQRKFGSKTGAKFAHKTKQK